MKGCPTCGTVLTFVAVMGPPVPQAARVMRTWVYRCSMCPQTWEARRFASSDRMVYSPTCSRNTDHGG